MKTTALVLLVCLPVTMAMADSASISFSELTGSYEISSNVAPNFDYPNVRTVDFTIPDHITSIDQMQLVLSGEWFMGEITCDDGSGPDVSPIAPGLSVFLTSPAFPGDFFHATIQPEGGSFTELTATFESCCPPGTLDLDQLIGAEIHAELFMDLILIGICSLTTDSYGTIDDVRFEILGTVPVENTTLSEVKSLYR